MVVDKPFVFALRDRKTGLILFMGYVGAPRA
jgi:serine protease inhibitor